MKTIDDSFYKNDRSQNLSLFIYKKFKTSGSFLKTIVFFQKQIDLFENVPKTKQKTIV